MVPVSCGLGPSLDFLVGLEVVPCLATLLVQEPPSLDVGSLVGLCCGGSSLTVQLLLMIIYGMTV